MIYYIVGYVFAMIISSTWAKNFELGSIDYTMKTTTIGKIHPTLPL